MNAVGYIRVSTEDQARDGVSLDAQRGKIAAWAEFSGHQVTEIFADEGISGKSMRGREGLAKALEVVEQTGGILVVYSLSRLARSVRDTIAIAERLARANAQIASCQERIDTSTAAGKMFFQIMAVLAEFERETISERTQTALDHKWKKGEAPGNTPYGFAADDAGKLVVNQREREGLGIILQGIADDEPYAAIARRLGRRGIPTRGGKPWGRGVVRKMVAYYRTERGRTIVFDLMPEYRDLLSEIAAQGALAAQTIEPGDPNEAAQTVERQIQ